MYVSVTLRNVNLRSRSECQFARTPGQDIGYVFHDDVGMTFLGDGGRGGQRGWPFATYVFAEPSA